ncbi:MAG TPA: hypothetical protein VMB20_13920 [Candidatus Acidoferrum sp.]|nr:hypothetical protein [Candidatus Acidoferrum sp.]
MPRTRFFGTVLVLMLALTARALAGPPLICHANEINGARSLPWLATDNWNGADPGYDLSHLANDTLAVLGPQTPIVVRMETIRRAVIYASHRSGLTDELAVRLFARTLDAQANGSPDPSAWFDAGYFVETVRDGARIFPNVHVEQIDGLAWMHEAERLGGTGMESAVAMVEHARAERK